MNLSVNSNPETHAPPAPPSDKRTKHRPHMSSRSGIRRLQALDDRLLRVVVKRRSTPVTFGFRFLCRLFDPDIAILWLSCLALGGGMYASFADQCAVGVISASLLVVITKRSVKRTRPDAVIQAMAPPDAYSFPSGHTTAAFALAIATFGTIPQLVPALILVAVVVGYARMYFGVHYPVDVLAGASIGVFAGSVVAVSGIVAG